jgi:hypothetical protein
MRARQLSHMSPRGLALLGMWAYLSKEWLAHAQCEGHVCCALSCEFLGAHGDFALIHLEIDHDAGLCVAHCVEAALDP